LLSIAFRLEKIAYRWANITLAIIVALVAVALWPEHQPSAVKSAGE